MLPSKTPESLRLDSEALRRDAVNRPTPEAAQLQLLRADVLYGFADLLERQDRMLEKLGA